MMLTDDHVDLLTSAAMAWGILPLRAEGSSSRPALDARLQLRDAHDAGRALREENHRAGMHEQLEPAEVGQHSPRTIDLAPAVQVLKAIQAARWACSSSPSWDSSAARALLEELTWAAVIRLEGYEWAPWSWSRPRDAEEHVLGIASVGELPPVQGVAWVGPQEAVTRWDSAPVVVVTVSAASALPPVPARSGVVLLTVGEDLASIWEALAALPFVEQIVSWPSAATWLTQLARGLEHMERVAS